MSYGFKNGLKSFFSPDTENSYPEYMLSREFLPAGCVAEERADGTETPRAGRMEPTREHWDGLHGDWKCTITMVVTNS